MTNVTGPDLGEWITREVEEITDGVERAVERTADELRDQIREKIETSGARPNWVRDWSGMPHAHGDRSGSTPGRVASGKMRDAVKSRVTQTKTSVTGEAGWIDEWEPYFGLQEAGGKHNIIPGLQIEGMYAIADAAADAEYILDKNLDEQLK